MQTAALGSQYTLWGDLGLCQPLPSRSTDITEETQEVLCYLPALSQDLRGVLALRSIHFQRMALFLVCFFRATPVAYGISQARGGIGAVASGLHHSHSNMGSKPRL